LVEGGLRRRTQVALGIDVLISIREHAPAGGGGGSVYLPPFPLLFFLTHTLREIHTRGGLGEQRRALFLDAGAQAQVETRLAVIPLR